MARRNYYNFWPYALLAACDAHNNWSVDENGKTPMMKLLNLDIFPEMKFEHTFGCPVYILDSKLQSSGLGPPKWEPRSRLGIYLGRSPYHAGSVALVLNPRTGHVSPQYHLVFDDDFTTVPYLSNNTENPDVPSHWQALCESSTECSTPEPYDLNETWFQKELETQAVQASAPDSTGTSKPNKIVAENVSTDTTMESTPSLSNPVTNSEGDVSENQTESSPKQSESQPEGAPPQEGVPVSEGVTTPDLVEPPASEGDSGKISDDFINLSTSGLRRSPRNHKPGNLPKHCFVS